MNDDLNYTIRSLSIPVTGILDVCAVNASYGTLLVLTSDGGICGANVSDGTCKRLSTITLPDLPKDDGHIFRTSAWRLHANPSGTVCAIVADKGRHGMVIDPMSGTITMTLDGGDYYENTVPFSACFLRIDGIDVFVHRTQWNRLDMADAATGHLLTDRHIDSYDEAGAPPAHYLDYFHGQLWPSPDGRRILDSGWIWHPVAVPRAWSISNWLRENPWESEDGSSVVELANRANWLLSACWINDHEVAIWGLVDSDDQAYEGSPHRSGVQISDMRSSDRSRDRQWSIDMNSVPRQLFCDGRRLFIAGETSTSIWDVAAMTMMGEVSGFGAHVYDAQRRALVAVDDVTLVELSFH